MDMIGGAKILSDRFERRLNHDTDRHVEADAGVTPRERVGSLDAPVKVGGAPSSEREWRCLCGRWNAMARAFCSCGKFWQRSAVDGLAKR